MCLIYFIVNSCIKYSQTSLCVYKQSTTTIWYMTNPFVDALICERKSAREVGRSMKDRDQFADIIEYLYNTIENPHLWHNVLEKIAQYCGASHSFITERKGVHGEPISFFESGFGPNYFDLYGQHFYVVDVWSQNLAQYTFNQFHASHVVCDDSVFLNSEIYCDFAKPEGIRHSIGCFLGDPYSDYTTELASMRNINQHHFDPETIQAVNRFVPHIQQVQQIARKLGSLEHHNAKLESALDSFHEAIFLCDQYLNIEFCNSSALALQSKSRLFSGGNSALRFKEQSLRGYLSYLVVKAADVRNLENRFVKRLMIASDGDTPYLVKVTPWQKPNMGRFAGHANFGVRITLSLMQVNRLPHESDIASVFSLTMTEAAVLKFLCEGKSIEEIAVKRETTISTVRQQVKSCMAKTKCQRQAEMVANTLNALLF